MTLDFYRCFKNVKSLKEFDGKFVVYRVYNEETKKSYIGITSRLRRRVKEHIWYSIAEKTKCCCYLHRAIKKHGFNRFELEILDTASESEEELNKREMHYIEIYKSNNPEFGYNLTSGGRRNSPNENTITKKIESSKKQQVAKYSLDGIFIEKYSSVREAARQNKIADTDIHRCHKKKWSRNGLMYRKFENEPELKIDPYFSKAGKNLIEGDGFKGQNKIKCILFNKLKNQIEFKADSITAMSKISGIHDTTLHKIFKNDSHKKWKLIKLYE